MKLLCLALVLVLASPVPAAELNDVAGYLKVYRMYEPLLAKLTPETKAKLLEGTYERLFDEAQRRVRGWEKENVR